MPAEWRPSSAASRHLLPASGEKDLRLLPLHRWNQHVHGRSHPDDALDVDVAVVLVDDLLCGGEAEAGAVLALDEERLEDERELLDGDAGAGVAQGEVDVRQR